MCYTRRKIEGGVGALRESDDANFLKPNGQSRNLNIYEQLAFSFVVGVATIAFDSNNSEPCDNCDDFGVPYFTIMPLLKFPVLFSW